MDLKNVFERKQSSLILKKCNVFDNREIFSIKKTS